MNNGTKVAKFRDTVNCAIELTCNIAFDGGSYPKGVFFTVGDATRPTKTGIWKKKCRDGAWEKIDSQGFPLHVEAWDVQWMMREVIDRATKS